MTTHKIPVLSITSQAKNWFRWSPAFILLFFSSAAFSQQATDSANSNYLQDTFMLHSSLTNVFAVKSISGAEIKNNFVQHRDPLRVVNAYAFSVNPSEKPDLYFRGSLASQSNVLLNGVPIDIPYKNERLGRLGSTGIFNASTIEQINIHPTASPSIYGRNSGGAANIQTLNNIDRNNYELVLALDQINATATHKINNDNNHFIQAFTSYHYDRYYQTINKNSLSKTPSYGTFDGGINYHVAFTKKSSLNFYNYFLLEEANSLTEPSAYFNVANFRKQRNFHIINFQQKIGQGNLLLSGMYDRADTKDNVPFTYLMDNLNEKFFANLSYDISFDNFSIRSGVDFEKKYNYYYSFHRTPVSSPSFSTYSSTHHNNEKNIQPYTYVKYNASPKLQLGVGVRYIHILEDTRSISVKEQSTWNYQFNAHYKINNHHQLILGAGEYRFAVQHLTSFLTTSTGQKQVSLDYSFQKNTWNTSAAVFYRHNALRTLRHIEISNQPTLAIVTPYTSGFGWEISVEKKFSESWNVATSLNQFYENDSYINSKSDNHTQYMTRIVLNYTNESIVNLSLSYIGRSRLQNRKHVTVIYPSYTSGEYTPPQIFYSDFNNYGNLSLHANKSLLLQQTEVSFFIDINNLLNRGNDDESTIVMNELVRNKFSRRGLNAGIIIKL